MKHNILQSWNNEWPVIKSTSPLPTGEGVLDSASFSTIEVNEVFNSINQASTLAGQSVLYRSITCPSDSLKEIQGKQQAVKEIQENKAVRDNIENIVKKSTEQESHLHLLLFGEFLGGMGTARHHQQIEGYGYKQYRRGVRFMLDLAGFVYASEMPDSPYLKEVFNRINTFSKSRIYSLMEGPVYNTEKGLKTKDEQKGSFVPFTIFKPRVFKPLLISIVMVVTWLLSQLMSYEIPGLSFGSGAMSGLILVPLLLVYFPVIGSYDRDNCIIPLRDEFKNSKELGDALDALGQLDELLSIIKFSEKYGSNTVLPLMIESEHHSINLVNAKNPVLGMQNETYVGNDFTLEEEKLVFVTGPNSGGKTAFCKTVTQIQLLAQIGCFVPAQSATLSVADKIFYQAPEISHLDDGEGRFGTELKRTKDVFLASTAKSLIVLDELSEGTTFEEKMESSTNVLDGFYRKGNSTILITHNHQLVDVFINKNEGIAKQVEFANDEPTYKLIEGISRVSHADRVAKKIGFSAEDIENYLSNPTKA